MNPDPLARPLMQAHYESPVQPKEEDEEGFATAGPVTMQGTAALSIMMVDIQEFEKGLDDELPEDKGQFEKNEETLNGIWTKYGFKSLSQCRALSEKARKAMENVLQDEEPISDREYGRIIKGTAEFIGRKYADKLRARKVSTASVTTIAEEDMARI